MARMGSRTIFSISNSLFLFYSLFLVLVFIDPTSSFATEKGFNVSADSISFQKEIGLVEAKGNVEANYRDLSVKAGRLLFFSKEGRIIASDNFSLFRDNYILSGKNLDYFVWSKTGTADAVELQAESTKIKSIFVKVSPDEVYFSEASFSSCNLASPHYKITAQNMSFYPSSGWIVEYLGLFWINDIPVVPVPTYVFDTGLGEGFYRRKNIAPLPEIGSNIVDGGYLKNKIVWRMSNYSYGLLDLNYTAKKGLGGGFESNYIINNDNEGNLRIYTSKVDGVFGGITHVFYFGERVPRERFRQFLYQVIETIPRRKYDLTLDLSFRERINYERVNFLPKASLHYIDIPFAFMDFRPKAEVSLFNATEESSGVSKIGANIKSSIDYSQPILGDFVFKGGLDFDATTYNLSSQWIKLLGRFDFAKSFLSSFEGSAGFSHFFVNDGASPFIFENYRFFPNDEIRSSLQYKMGLSSFKVSINYNSPLFTIKDLDYNAAIRFHCFDAGITWRSQRGELLFDLTLVSG